MKYIVSVAVDSRIDLEVDAENPQEARLNAEALFATANLANAEVVDFHPVNCCDAKTGDIVCDY